MTEKQEKEQTKRVLEFQALLAQGWEKSKKMEVQKKAINSMREINLGSSPVPLNSQWI